MNQTWVQCKQHLGEAGLQLNLMSPLIDRSHAIAALAKLSSRGRPLRPSPIKEKRPTVVFITGAAEKYYAVSQVVHSVPWRKDALGLSVCHLHMDPEFDWLTSDGELLLKNHLRTAQTQQSVILQAAPAHLINADLEAVVKLRDLAQSMNSQICLSTAAESVADFGAVAALADDTILSEPCIADFGYTFAWSIESSAARPFHADGLGKLMIQMAVESGRASFNCTRFVAAEPSDRVIWYLAAEGHERAKIANVLKTSIDVIDQRLALMRPLQSAHVPDNWRNAFASMFDFSAVAS